MSLAVQRYFSNNTGPFNPFFYFEYSETILDFYSQKNKLQQET